MKDYYKILNIAKTATEQEIKKAYRKSAIHWHPDKNKAEEATERFIEINEAYNILIENEKRQTYDKLLDEFLKSKEDFVQFSKTQMDFKIYESWVKFERIKVMDILKNSTEEGLTNFFYILDNYGGRILILFLLLFLLFLSMI